jgi:hypothetical protein
MNQIPALPSKSNAAIRYDVLGDLSGFSMGTLRDAVSQAMALWTEETPVAFIRTAAVPDLTITFRPLGVGEGRGNALIEINGSLPWRYGPGRQQQSSLDLVTSIAHEVGHRLGMPHNVTDPRSIMSETQANGTEVRTLPGVDVGEVQRLRGRASVVESVGVHGSSVAIEDPNRMLGVLRRGPHAEIRAANTETWFHFAPPTPVRAGGRGVRLHAVRLKLRTYARVRLAFVHVWDGDSFRQVHLLDVEGDDAAGSRLWDLRLGVARKPVVTEAIGISVNVDFINAGSNRVDFISAGCEFVDRGSVTDAADEVVPA